MDAKRTLRFGRVGDILCIDKASPYEEQECDELEDGILVRLNPESEEVEGFEVLFWNARLMRGETLELPVEGSLRLAI